MEHASENIIDILSERGYRITGARKKIIAAMEEASQPHTIREIAKHVAVDEASVYRTIALLDKEELVEVVGMPDGSDAFALHAGHDHHHHLICTSCNTVVHLPCTDEKPKLSLRETGFAKVFEHEITYYGLCKSCA